MKKDQIEGAAKSLGGKVRMEIGKLVGSPDQQLKGLQVELDGKLRQKIGNAEEAVKDLQKP